jgi:endonuclease/exonuclease/phosphatase family metal-dependent hydrolase
MRCRRVASAAAWTRSPPGARHDIVGLQEADPGSLRSGFTNQTHYLAQRAGFNYWSHQPNRRMGGVASSANGLLSKLEPVEVQDHPLPGRIGGRGVLLAKFGDGTTAWRWRWPICRWARARGCRSWASSPSCCPIPQRGADGRLQLPGRTPGNAGAVPEDPAAARRPASCRPSSWRPDRAIDHILVSRAWTTAPWKPYGRAPITSPWRWIDVPPKALR